MLIAKMMEISIIFLDGKILIRPFDGKTRARVRKERDGQAFDHHTNQRSAVRKERDGQAFDHHTNQRSAVRKERSFAGGG
ncbi:hypothetical protein KV01_004293 [Salmonella enterica subsp. enterica]|nr:hypothetical protein [Salmonella enterica subsp. enterica]HAF1583465.1 hypothetical protein [Salmonella enterica]